MIANTALCVALLLTTLHNASALGIILALLIAASTHPGLYPCSNSKVFSSEKRFSLASGSEHILTILNAREKGMFSVTWAGWQELVRRYWFLSVSFRYKSVPILPSIIWQEVSRNGKDSAGLHPQVGFNTFGGVVWDIINL